MLDTIDHESDDEGQYLAENRAKWEMQCRRGQSQAVTVVCDSWRDTGGRLWTPNMLAPVNVPAVKVTNKVWLIATVEFTRDRSGTRAALALMPPEAFSIEPSALNASDAQLRRAVLEGHAAQQVPGSGGVP